VKAKKTINTTIDDLKGIRWLLYGLAYAVRDEKPKEIDKKTKAILSAINTRQLQLLERLLDGLPKKKEPLSISKDPVLADGSLQAFGQGRVDGFNANLSEVKQLLQGEMEKLK